MRQGEQRSPCATDAASESDLAGPRGPKVMESGSAVGGVPGSSTRLLVHQVQARWAGFGPETKRL